jgi:peptidyl-prolyl cis-trans isomerase SurA
MDIDPAFKASVNEYRDGLLLYEIMEQEVWNKAKNDSIGIQRFYDSNSDKYFSDAQVEVEIIATSNKKQAKKINKQLNKGVAVSDLSEAYPEAIFSAKEWKKTSSSSLPQKLDVTKKNTSLYEHNNQHLIIRIHDYKPSQKQGLEEVRGRIISDYQEELEKEWIASLKEKYEVQINEQEIATLKQKLD